ncbi:Uncharacterised protein [Mycobacteroides abscessus subsp. abscessus]|nr:Uncharacterised protein [Mycobacteroides abscessus subsp. abscessus]
MSAPWIQQYPLPRLIAAHLCCAISPAGPHLPNSRTGVLTAKPGQRLLWPPIFRRGSPGSIMRTAWWNDGCAKSAPEWSSRATHCE